MNLFIVFIDFATEHIFIKYHRHYCVNDEFEETVHIVTYFDAFCELLLFIINFMKCSRKHQKFENIVREGCEDYTLHLFDSFIDILLISRYVTHFPFAY